MNVNLGLFTFGTFGNPNGYKHSLSYGKKEAISVCNTFDLNTNAIKLFEGTNLFSIKKGVFNNRQSLVFTIYTHALESNSNREGTFIGCSMIFIEECIEVPSIMKMLFEYLTVLKELNTTNSRFKVNHSDEFILPNFRFPKNINTQSFSKIPKIDTSINDSKLLIYCEINNVKKLWNDSIYLLNKYTEIFFTQSPDVTKYVQQKGLYQTINHNENQPNILFEIDKIKAEKNNRNLEFLKSIESKKTASITKLKELQNSLSSTVKVKEREKSNITSDLQQIYNVEQKINQLIRSFDTKINDLVHAFKSKKILFDELQEQERKIQNEFQHELLEYRKFAQNSESKPRQFESPIHQKTNVKVKTHKQDVQTDNKEFGINIFEIVSIVLAVLLIGSWVFFLFFQEPEIEYRNSPYSNQTEMENGNPIGQLKGVDAQKVNQELMINMTIDDVINIIFELNPNDVKKHFSSKRQEYLQFLIDANPNSFEKENNSYILILDSLGKRPRDRS